MSEENIKWYLSAILHEIKKLDSNFIGNINFKLHISGGVIANMMVALDKSVKMPQNISLS